MVQLPHDRVAGSADVANPATFSLADLLQALTLGGARLTLQIEAGAPELPTVATTKCEASSQDHNGGATPTPSPSPEPFDAETLAASAIRKVAGSTSDDFVFPDVSFSPGPFYVITVGHKVGIFTKWPNVAPNVVGVSGAIFEKCKTFSEARQSFQDALDEGTPKNTSEPKSTCSRHDAVNLSDSKPGRGHAATGVATIECIRHNMKRPMAVGDLQRGEKYCNIDYIFWKSLANYDLESIFISYDIACQWSINVRDRMRELDPNFTLFNGDVRVKYLVPKFHLPAHISKCRSNFSFNYTPGVGRTDGEAPERGWAESNPLAMSTKQMGPGSRRDTLDAHFGDYNWRKVIGMGTTLMRKLMAATSDMAEQVLIHRELESSLPKNVVAEWMAAMKVWEADPSKPNPFDVHVNLPTRDAVRQELAEAEARDLAAGKDFTLDANISPSVFISSGLDLENEQRALIAETSKLWQHAQDRQKTKLQLRGNALSRKIIAWSRFQELYMPKTVFLHQGNPRANATQANASSPQTYPLWLPSNVGSQVTFDLRLAEIEWRLRIAQAHDALESLRRNLRMRVHLRNFKNRWSRGQGANTRAKGALDTVNGRILVNAQEYRAAYKAIGALAPLLGKIGWDHEFKPLLESDIREISEADAGKSEGMRVFSWIWVVGHHSGLSSNEVFRDTLRLEWSKSYARAMRFVEEVELLSTEMRRVLHFFNWQAGWWRSLGVTWAQAAEMSEIKREGLIGYAKRQAAMRDDLSAQFTRLWSRAPNLISNAHASIIQSAMNFEKARPKELSLEIPLKP